MESNVKEQEYIFDPYYRLISFMIKKVEVGIFEPGFCKSILEQVIPAHLKPRSSNSTEGSPVNEYEIDTSKKTAPKIILSDKDAFYHHVCSILSLYMDLDKKNWQHKPIFKVFFI